MAITIPGYEWNYADRLASGQPEMVLSGNDGIMYKGWLTAGDGMYFFDQDGSMHTGWLMDGGNWYYMSRKMGAWLRMLI